jgi:hypothetical protein
VNQGPRLELLRPRTLGSLFSDSLSAYVRHFGAFVAIGAAVVVPVELAVSGIGLGQLHGGYSTSFRNAAQAVTLAEIYLVIGPLVTAMVVHALLAVADGERPRPGAAIVSGLEAFRPVFLAMVIAAAGVVIGFFAFVLPGIWLLVRWWFTPQAVVVDGRRSTAALQRSAELVQGSWWRVAGVLIAAGLVVAIPALVISIPTELWAKSADSQAIQLAGEVVASALTTPFQALMITLLYFDLLARRSLPATMPPVPPPPR